MPYLFCNNLVLLGQDVIRAFHWKIDFTKQVLYVSKEAFAQNNTAVAWPVTYENNRPHVALHLNGGRIANCLIDFGFTGIFDLNTKYTVVKNLIAQKQLADKTNEFYSTAMGLAGLGESKKESRYVLDSVYLANTLFANVYTTSSTNTNTKIGVGFFKNYCSTIILNFERNEFYIETKTNTNTLTIPLDARVSIKEGKFVVTDINQNKNSTGNTLSLGEIIKSIDGKSVSDYSSDCAFLLWNYWNKNETIRLEKMDGTIVVLKRTSNF
jgi:aryl carrier-like protein